jgi:hypothetical protein
MQQDEKQDSPQIDEETPGEMSELEIDKNIEDSFPASDPPSWTLGTDHSDSTKNEK